MANNSGCHGQRISYGINATTFATAHDPPLNFAVWIRNQDREVVHHNRTLVSSAVALCLTLDPTNATHAAELATSAVYTGEVLRNVDGGLQRGTAYLGNVDIDAQWKPTAGEHFTAYFHVLADHGEKPGDLVG